MRQDDNVTQLDRILSKNDVCDWIGVHPTTLDRWTKAALFPPKRQLGPGRIGWSRSAVEAWLAAR